MKVVAWNVRGQYSLLQLGARMAGNKWDILIVLEPSSQIKDDASDVILSTPILRDRGYEVAIRDANGERIVVLYRKKAFNAIEVMSLQNHPDYTNLQMQATKTNVVFSVDTRKPIVIHCTSTNGSTFRIMSVHAPYRNNDTTAGSYQSGLQDVAQGLGVDVILGDLNTYGTVRPPSHRSSSRSQYDFELIDTAPTSKGGYCLDKVFINKRLYMMMNSFFKNGSVVVKDPKDVDDAMEHDEDAKALLEGFGDRRSSRRSTQQSSYGKGLREKLDHNPVVLTLPVLQKSIQKLQITANGIQQYTLKRKSAPGNTMHLKAKVLKKLKEDEKAAIRNQRKKEEKEAKLRKDTRKKLTDRNFIVGDGNCLYRSLAHWRLGNQNLHRDVRRAIARYLLDNFENFRHLDFLNTDEQALAYFDDLLREGSWGGEFEIYLAALSYGITIRLHSVQGYNHADYNPNGAHMLELYHEDYHFYVDQTQAYQPR